MTENYLRQFRKSPDSRFVQKVHARLQKKERMQTLRKYSSLSALALIFMFGLLITFSSTVRAEVLRTLEEIAGLQFDITSIYPGGSDEDVTIVPGEYLTIEEVQSRFPSPVVLPAYIPQGYERRDDVMLTPFPDMPMLTITWQGKETGRIMLDIQHCSLGPENCGWTVGEGALEEITLNGSPAVVIRGAWNYDTKQYDRFVPTAIRWKYDENTIYMLSSWNRMPVAELIKIAESIP